MKALFIGSYPNNVEPYRSVFFRELVHQFADLGIECHVISCISVTAYKGKAKSIPLHATEYTAEGQLVHVYYPHIVTYSSKKIGKWNTIHLTQRSIEKAAIRQAKRLGIQFDFVYGHFFLGGGLTASKIGRILNIPSYIAYGECSFDTEVRNKYGDIKPKSMMGVKGIISVSSANCEDLKSREFAKNIPVFLSINSINDKVFFKKDKCACRKKFGFSQNDFIVGFVGYFIERKGPLRVLEACKDLDNVKLAFAGKGEQLPSGSNVIFCQPLKHEEIADFLNAVDVFVLPTLNEGCCNAVVEAMACGKAIISSDLPFNYDVLNNNNSILVNPKDISQIRLAIKKMRDDTFEREKIARQALHDSANFTISNRAQNILAFIKKTSQKD